jgi:ribosomal protein S9
MNIINIMISLFHKFIFWFKKILHIRSKEKPDNIHPVEDLSTINRHGDEQIQPEIPSEQRSDKTEPPASGIQNNEIKTSSEPSSTEEGDETSIKQTIKPGKGGGRLPGSIGHPGKNETIKVRPNILKPDIICWNEGRSWVIGLEVQENIENLSVTQNGTPLVQDSEDETRYYLKNVEESVKIAWDEEEKEITLIEAKRNYFLFKMRKNWAQKQPGRLVSNPTTGFFLAVVPQDWKRDEEIFGSAINNPEESVRIRGYKAHFIYLEQDRNSVIGFVAANGERIRVESGNSRFQLVGREIPDASEYMGPLFAEHPPSIKSFDKQKWTNVAVIDVAEISSGRYKRRKQIVPRENTEEKILLDKIIDSQSGWYFVRIYDNDDNLLESMDFRFMNSLENIKIDNYTCLPSPYGHCSVTVRFHNKKDYKIEPKSKVVQQILKIQQEDNQIIVTMPPKPDCDLTHWVLCDNDAQVEFSLLLERIWWSIGDLSIIPTDWTDKPVTISRDDFSAISNKALWIRFPRPRFVREIDIGFSRAKRRTFPVEVSKKELSIPLRYFSETGEIENRQVEAKFTIWVQSEGTKYNEAVIALLTADRHETIENQWQGNGRKNTAIARAVITKGHSEFIVNNDPVWEYFKETSTDGKYFLERLLKLEAVKSLTRDMKICVKIKGSQPKYNKQIKAVTHAVARTLICYDPKLKKLLKENGFSGVKVTQEIIKRCAIKFNKNEKMHKEQS